MSGNIHTEQDIIDAVQHVADELGHPPTQADYEEYSADDEPGRRTINRRLGGWIEALEAAGLDPSERQSRSSGHTDWSREAILEAFEDAIDDPTEWPNISEMCRENDDLPSASVVPKYFDSTKTLRTELGLPPTRSPAVHQVIMDGPVHSDDLVNGLKGWLRREWGIKLLEFRGSSQSDVAFGPDVVYWHPMFHEYRDAVYEYLCNANSLPDKDHVEQFFNCKLNDEKLAAAKRAVERYFQNRTAVDAYFENNDLNTTNDS